MSNGGTETLFVKINKRLPKIHFLAMGVVVLAVIVACSVYLRRKPSLESPQASAVSDSLLYEARDKPATLMLRGVDGKTGRLINFPWVIRLSQCRLNQLKQLVLAYLRGATYGKSRTPALPGIELNEIYWTPDNLVVVDLSAAGVQPEKTGYWEEVLFVRGLIETAARNFYEVRQVKILLDGREGTLLAGHYALGYSESSAQSK